MRHAARWLLFGVLVSLAVALGASATKHAGGFGDTAAARRIPPQYVPVGAHLGPHLDPHLDPH
jgi:hypothetical protein